jgi:methylthioribulose-1-phosphate dehydratase
MVVDVDGAPVQSDARASAETLLHTAIYNVFPEAGVVLHTHSVNATVLSRALAQESELRLTGYELQKAFPGHNSHEDELVVPIFENTQDIGALAAHTRDWFHAHPEQPGYLIRGHGLYTWGQTMADCLQHVEAFEFLFACELELRKLQG